jgi:hypothetical protein
MGNLSINLEEDIPITLRQDNVLHLKEIIQKNNIKKDQTFTINNRTLIQLCALYNSPNCLKLLIELGNNINIPEIQDNNTPLILACKFNYIEIVKILLEQENIKLKEENNDNLNCLDMSIIRGNYEISIFLIENTILEPLKSLEEYEELNRRLKYPLFNIKNFYYYLINKIPYNEVPSFSLPKKRSSEFIGKVPDPNESWSNFIKRLSKFELYQPPLVDAKSVNLSNSIYMKIQSKLCESEYDIKMPLNNNNENNIDNVKRIEIRNNNNSLNSKIYSSIYEDVDQLNISKDNNNIIFHTDILRNNNRSNEILNNNSNQIKSKTETDI